MALVSFIIPCYNAEKTLKKCLASVFAQSLKSFEIIVVDNNSIDNSVTIVKEMQKEYPRLQLVFEKKQGRSYTRNLGAKHAKGFYLAFIDADVYLDQDWGEKMVTTFEKNKSVVAGQGQIIPCQDHGLKSLNDFRYRCVFEETRGLFILTLVKRFESPMINSAACLYKRNTFETLGGFDVLLERHEDIDLSRRAFFTGGVILCSSQATAHVIFHGEGWLDFIKRSFDDGFYKAAYLKKWRGQTEPYPAFSLSRVNLLKTMILVSSFHDIVKLFLTGVNMIGRLMGRLSSYHKKLYWSDSTFENLQQGKTLIDDHTLS